METITSLENTKIKKWYSLHQKKHRDETGLFLVEGEHLISEAIRAKCLVYLITDTENHFSFSPAVRVTAAIMKKLSQNISPVHMIGVCRKPEKRISKPARILILDGIQDPGNLGTLVRTAVSFSFDEICCSKNTCDLYNDKAIRSTQGALFHIPVIYTDIHSLIPVLQKEGFSVIATTLEKSKTMKDIPVQNQMAFILGNEGNGVESEVQMMADDRLRIEMDGFESLNVAVAGGIIMYHYRKREELQ